MATAATVARMRTRLGGWLAVVAVLVGAGVAGHHLSDRPMLAAQSGTSTSGSGGVGTDTDGGSDGGTSGGNTSGGGGGGGGGAAPAPTPTAPATTAPATTAPATNAPAPTHSAPTPTGPTGGGGGGGNGGGGGSGSASRQGDDPPADGSSGFSPGDDDGGGEHDDEAYTLQPAEPAPERRRVAPGRKTDCPAGTRAEVRCFGVDDWDDAEAVEVPDGAGGTVIIPLAADIDTHADGTSISGGSNVDLDLHIDVTTGRVVEVDRRADNTTQAVLLTVAVLLLLLVLVGVGATLLRLQRGAI